MPSLVEAALHHAADAKLHSAFQGKGLAAAAFMAQSTSAGGSVHTLRMCLCLYVPPALKPSEADVELSADTAAWSSLTFSLPSARMPSCFRVFACFRDRARPLASDLVLDMQERSSHYMVEVAARGG